MATLREPRLRGMSVEARPMAAAERTQFGLPPQIDDEVRARTQQLRTQRASVQSPLPQGGVNGQATPQVASASGSARPGVAVGGGTGPAVGGGGVDGSPRPGRLAGLRTAVTGGTTDVGGAVRSVGRGVGSALRSASASPLAAGLALGTGAVEGFNTDTETYRKRFGLETDNPSFAGDLGVRALGVASDVGNAVTFGGLRKLQNSMYGEGQWEGTKTADAPTAPAAPAASAAQPMFPPSRAGQGRGNVEDPRRADRDASSMAFGRSRDFTNELASVPRNLPADLRDGVVYKTKDANGRTVYSGRNVGDGAQMVDGMGATLRGGGGTVSTVPGMSQDEIDRTLRRGTYADAAPTQAAGPAPGLVASGGLLDTPRARRQAEALRQGSEQLSNQRRGQDLEYGAAMAGVAQRDAAARLPYQAQAAARARLAGYLRGPQGQDIDPAAAQAAALAAGDADAAKALGEMADNRDSRATKRSSALREAVAADSVVTNKEGQPEVNKALQETNSRLIEQLATARGIPVEQIMADAPTMGAVLKLAKDINSKRSTGPLQMIGLADEDPTLSSLGELRGRQMNPVGVLDALFTGREFGDRAIQTGDRARYISRQTLADSEVQKLLKELGIQ